MFHTSFFLQRNNAVHLQWHVENLVQVLFCLSKQMRIFKLYVLGILGFGILLALILRKYMLAFNRDNIANSDL